MVKFYFRLTDPKHKKIARAVFRSRIKLIIASSLMSIAVVVVPLIMWLGIIIAVSSALMFSWDIGRQIRSGIDIEDRISRLEKQQNPNGTINSDKQ